MYLILWLPVLGTILVPYRDRAEHLEKFLRWMHPFLQAQNVRTIKI